MESTGLEPSTTGAGHATSAGTGTSDQSAAAQAAKLRKRTKTGCLTCRKRRIKCGEERPICNNCIKSKRHCEGYNQRVIFKPPIGDWPTHSSTVTTVPYHSSMLPGSRVRPQTGQQQNQHQIQPRSQSQYDFPNAHSNPTAGLQPLDTGVLLGGPSPYPQDHGYPQQPQASSHSQLPTPDSATSYYGGQVPPPQVNYSAQFAAAGPGSYQGEQFSQGRHFQNTPLSYDTQVGDQKPAVSNFHSFPPYQGQYYQQQQQQQQHPSTQEEHVSYNLTPHTPNNAEQFTLYEQRPPLVQVGDHNASHPLSHIGSLDMGRVAYPPSSQGHSAGFHDVPIPQHDSNDVKYVAQHTVLEQPVAVSHAQRNFKTHLLTSGFAEDHVSPSQVLDEAAVENQDDDYYDVRSDEEMEDEPNNNIISNRDFGMILRIHEESTSEISARRYDAFLYEGMLNHYEAERVANPLKNPQTARVFAHFIYATGPSLSVFERNPRTPSAIFEGRTPPALQSLWTYYLPMKALSHQGLLHAMLAMASLHIARLQGASSTPSYKHYAYALKRLGRYLGDQKKRHSIATLATSLLLAYYEVMTAEHAKWSTHLVGGRLLITEKDFRTMSQEARKLKARQSAYEKNAFPYQHPEMLIDQRHLKKGLEEDSLMPNQELCSTIFGKEIRYDESGRAFDFESSGAIPRSPDLKTFEVFQDLYWWYARQDAFQSIVSGNPLIMDYERWSDCPPRAPFGRIDHLYGTHDHIILLLGRIADFITRDRERKIKQVEATGGQWKPMPGMPMGPPPQPGQFGQGEPAPSPTTSSRPMGPPQGMAPQPGMTGGPPAGWTGPPSQGYNMGVPQLSSPVSPQMPNTRGPPQGPPQGPPMFYGMAPAGPQAPMPASYAQHPESTFHGRPSFHPPTSQANPPRTPQTPQTPSASQKFPDLSSAYTTALQEWTSINAALQTLYSILNNTPTFHPLGPEYAPRKPSPFGDALQYRRHDIGIIWSQLHMASIVLTRAHPAMPPAAMQAAGIAAPQTGKLAREVGRINAGIDMPGSSGFGIQGQDDAPLNPSLGAALIESTMPIFFAGIQYREADQRAWTVTRLLDIDRRTGWASAGIIARGCETSWEMAGRMGRAPRYESRRTRRPGESGEKENEGPVRERVIELGEGVERRWWVRDGGGRLPWSMGLLATEEDLRRKAEEGREGDA